tara:strand:+ start:2063 stop:2554 length:492 start_codon:yes stop_codon:yes gene_type:complete
MGMRLNPSSMLWPAVLLITALLLLSGCATKAPITGPAATETEPAEPPKPIGSGRGKLAPLPQGILAGSQLSAPLDQHLTHRDRQLMLRIIQSALEITADGEKRAWQNPKSNFEGTVIPQPPFPGPQGKVCREYQQTVWVKGTRQTAYETACRTNDGTWRILSP